MNRFSPKLPCPQFWLKTALDFVWVPRRRRKLRSKAIFVIYYIFELKGGDMKYLDSAYDPETGKTYYFNIKTGKLIRVKKGKK